jgi:hypothetical protein
MSIPQLPVPQRLAKPARKRRKPRPPIAAPEHYGYFARIPLPWILQIERQYRRAERAEQRAEQRAANKGARA